MYRERVCRQCGAKYRRNNENYCSRDCYNIGRLKPRIEGDCENCGRHYVTKYPVTHWLYNNKIQRRYCSTECRLDAQEQKQDVTCIVCGVVRHISPSVLKFGNPMFCSRACSDKWHVGENSPLWKNGATNAAEKLRKSPEYREWRTAVFIRDNRTCVMCGSKKDIEADHIKPRFLYPELTLVLSNGRTLCHECHIKTPSYMNQWYKEKPSLIQ